MSGLVRGLCVFGGAVLGVGMVVRPELMVPLVILVMVLASIAANYAAEPRP